VSSSDICFELRRQICEKFGSRDCSDAEPLENSWAEEMTARIFLPDWGVLGNGCTHRR